MDFIVFEGTVIAAEAGLAADAEVVLVGAGPQVHNLRRIAHFRGSS
jgi:hypothetical protein